MQFSNESLKVKYQKFTVLINTMEEAQEAAVI